jgi:hypothetical protein
VSGQHDIPAALTPGSNRALIEKEARWAQGQTWTFGEENHPLQLTRLEIRTVQLVA